MQRTQSYAIYASCSNFSHKKDAIHSDLLPQSNKSLEWTYCPSEVVTGDTCDTCFYNHHTRAGRKKY